jgi:hypothetical protein
MLVLGAVVMAAFVLMQALISASSADLHQHGLRTTGYIATLYPDTGHQSGHADVRYEVDSTAYQRPVDLGSDADHYQPGQIVTVIYDRNHPGRMTIDGEDNQPAASVAPAEVAFAIGLPLLLVGLASTWRWLRNWQVMSGGPWLVHAVTTLDAWSGRLIDVTGVGPIRLARVAPSVFLICGPVWLVGRGRRTLLSPGASGRLLLARGPRTTRERDRWLDELVTWESSPGAGRSASAASGVWRPSVCSRVLALLPTAMFAVVGVGWLTGTIAVTGGGAAASVMGAAIIILAVTVAFLVGVRFRLTLTEDELEVRNVRSFHIPLSDIEIVTSGNGGMIVTMRGGKPDVTALAVLSSAWAERFHTRSRSDRAARLINAAVGAHRVTTGLIVAPGEGQGS